MNRQRVIVVMLAVFCVLLALNLVKGEPEAMGQGQGPPDAPVVPVAMSVEQIHFCTYRVFRMWSDGSVNTTLVNFACNSPQPLCAIQTTCTDQVID